MAILLRLPQVIERTGLKRSTVYREISRGAFPKPVKLTEKTSAWPEEWVDAWIESKIRASEGR